MSDTFGDGITENVSMIRSGYLRVTQNAALIVMFFHQPNTKLAIKTEVLFSHLGNQ